MQTKSNILEPMSKQEILKKRNIHICCNILIMVKDLPYFLEKRTTKLSAAVKTSFLVTAQLLSKEFVLRVLQRST